nr:tyrosine protein kinase HTK16 [Hymenolepis microstoma]
MNIPMLIRTVLKYFGNLKKVCVYYGLGLSSNEVYGVMLDCWAYVPETRPKFSHLLAIFRHFSTNVYENVAAPSQNTAAAQVKTNGSMAVAMEGNAGSGAQN